MEDELFKQRTDLEELSASVARIREAMNKVIIGQHELTDLLIAGLLADGHLLIEGVPGVAKTLAARLLAKCIRAGFSRIQFTPDLMPSDVIGTPVFNPKEVAFEFKKGPVFGNVILVDEINRAPAKTQAALFEVMEERQVTVDGTTYRMQEPFVVLATQNPVEHEGTYRLPEAQLDRFLFKIEVKYPSLEDETALLISQHRMQTEDKLMGTEPLLDEEQIRRYRAQVRCLHIDDKLLEFIAKIVRATRTSKSLYLGASPRAALAVANSAKAVAAISGRDFVTPEDILKVIPPVLRHRVIPTPDKEMEGISADEILAGIVREIEIPR